MSNHIERRRIRVPIRGDHAIAILKKAEESVITEDEVRWWLGRAVEDGLDQMQGAVSEEKLPRHTMSYSLHVNLTTHTKQRLKETAERQGITMTALARTLLTKAAGLT